MDAAGICYNEPGADIVRAECRPRMGETGNGGGFVARIAFDRERVLGAIDAVVRRTMNMDLTWDWPGGVAYYGVCEAARATGRGEYLDMLKSRIDEYMDLGLPIFTVNTCAMGHALLTLHEVCGEDKYKEAAQRKIDYLCNHALRFGDRVLQHTVSAGNDFPEQCWADTLFMAAFFMLRAGVAWGDEALINDALNQYRWHIEYLQDKRTGLWYHGYDNIACGHMSGLYWGRANAWAAYTMSQVARVLPRCYLYPQYMDVDGALSEQLAALKAVQTENGLWRTILDDPESYEEVSASAGIAAAMVVRGNPLHIKYIDKAVEGVLANVSPEGRVLNVSAGTAVMRDRDGYRNISRRWTQGWGQGLALAFFAALLESES